MKNKWLLCILLMLFLPFGLFAQVAPPLEEQKTETQEAPENNNEVTTNSDTNTDGDAGKTIKGVINDEQGETIIGASVIIKGEDTGTTSDMDGRFTLEAPEGAILVISYIGYHTQEVKVRKRSLLRVVLKEDNQLLDEVVVVGYGTVKKSDLTGAVSGVSNRQYKNQPVQRVENILQGRTPGVEVTATSGMPGASMKVRVRGTTSINKSSDPLYVIDGIISSSGLDGINPSDIQSMEILKDASSTAIYGSRGSNGVILITTKQGSEGKAQVTFDASVGLSTVRKQYDLLNAYEYATALNDIRGSSTISAEDLEAYKNGTKGINWTDLLTRTGITQDYRLAISGGNEKVKYLISGNVLDQEAITIMSDYKRYGIRANIDSEVKPWLTISAKLNASSLHKHNEGGANWLHVTNFSPTMELKDPETGVYNTDPYNMIGSSPYGEMIVNNSDSYSYNLNANLTLLFKIMKGLTLSVQGGYDYDNSPSYSFRSKLDSPGAINSASNTNALHNYWQNTNNLTWQKQFGDHSFTAMGVWEISRSWDSQLKGTGSNLNNESVGYWNLGNAAIRDASNSYTEFSLASGIVRANYDYKKRYFITAALRADGSSKFQPENRWAFFGGVSGGWRISEEEFVKGLGVFDDLKLRLSYGTVGNQGGIDRYDGVQLYDFKQNGGALVGSGLLSYVDTNGKLLSTDRTWEVIKNYNIGLDFGFLDNRLTGTAELFWKKCNNMLIDVTYPGTLGDKAPTANRGSFKANGWEGTINWSDKIGEISYHLGGTFTYTTNKLVDNGGDAVIKSGVVSNREGYPLNSVFGLKYCGKIQTQDQLDKYINQYANGNNNIAMPGNLRLGDNMYEDVNKDGKLTEADYVYLGTDDPKVSFSFNAGLSWKGFDVSVIFQGAGKRTVWRGGENNQKGKNDNWRIPMMSWYNNSTNQSVGNVWSAETPNAHYPTYTHQTQINLYNYICSSWSVEDGAYLRLKNVTLGYTFPANVLSKTKFISYARIYVSGADLWENSKIKDGWDPEASRKVETFGRYPFTRNLTVGLNLTF